MIFPERPPRTKPTLEHYTYYDHQVVAQPDGRLAAFTWNNKQREKGWMFSHWEDADGFHLLNGDEQIGEIAKQLLDAVQLIPEDEDLPIVGPGEVLHAYEYGGFMSMRGGWFTTDKNAPNKVLRYKQTRMS
jgi:hypothetical protein